MKRIWIAVSIAALLLMLAGAGIWMGTEPSSTRSPSSDSSAKAGEFTPQAHQPLPVNSISTISANQDAMMRQQQNQQTVLEVIQKFQKKPGNLNQLLTSIQQNCNVENCQALLQQTLANYPDQAFAAMLQRLLDRMPAYDKAMQSVVMATNTNPRQRYEAIWSLRERILGKQEADLAFGEEHQFADYQFAYGDLLQRAPNLTPQQRLAELARLQQLNKDTIVEVDGAAGSYEKALQLSLIGVNDPVQQQKITQQLRNEYFSPQQAAQMLERDKQVTQQDNQVKQYQADLLLLNQEMETRKSSLSESAWQQQYQLRLEQLRRKHFS